MSEWTPDIEAAYQWAKSHVPFCDHAFNDVRKACTDSNIAGQRIGHAAGIAEERERIANDVKKRYGDHILGRIIVKELLGES